MKRLLLFVSIVCLSVMMFCLPEVFAQDSAECYGIDDFPYYQDFESSWSYDTSGQYSYSDCWITVKNNTFCYWQHDTDGYLSEHSLSFDGTFTYLSAADEWLISPVISFDGNQKLSFYGKHSSLGKNDVIYIYTLQCNEEDKFSKDNSESFTLSDSVKINSLEYTLYSRNLTSLNGNFRIALVVKGSDYGVINIDGIAFDYKDDCSSVSYLEVIPSSSETAELYFDTLYNNNQGWNIVYSEATDEDFDPYNPQYSETTEDEISFPYVISGLEPNKEYYFAVQQACYGDFSPTVKCTTLPQSVELPYYLDFEEYTEDIMTFSNTVNKWYIGDNAENTDNSSFCLYISDNDGEENRYTTHGISCPTYAYAVLNVNFPQDSAYSLSFDYKMQGDYSYSLQKDKDFIRVYALDTFYRLDFSGNFPEHAVLLGEYGTTKNVWTNVSIDLNKEHFYNTSQLILFCWYNDISSGQQPPAAIDNIYINSYSCLSPRQVIATDITDNSISLQWNAAANTVYYTVEYCLKSSPGQKETLITYDTSLVLNNLLADTEYVVKVYSECSVSGTGQTFKEFIFRTSCRIIQQLPFSENFNDVRLSSGFPACWTYHCNNSQSAVSYSSSAVNKSEGYLNLTAKTDTGAAYLIFPQADNSVDVKDLYVAFRLTLNSLTGKLFIGVIDDIDSVDNFTAIDSLSMQGDRKYNNEMIYFPLSSYQGNGKYITLKLTAAKFGGVYYLPTCSVKIDDIFIDTNSQCPLLYDFSLTNVSYDAITADCKSVFPVSDSISLYVSEKTDGYFDTVNSVKYNVTLSDFPYTIRNLQPDKEYGLALKISCLDTVSFLLEAKTKFAVTLPYFCNFEDSLQNSAWILDPEGVSTGTNYFVIDNKVTDSYPVEGNSLYITCNAAHEYKYMTYYTSVSTAELTFLTQGENKKYKVSFDSKFAGSGQSYLKVFVTDADSTYNKDTLALPDYKNNILIYGKPNAFGFDTAAYLFNDFNPDTVINYYGVFEASSEEIKAKKLIFLWRTYYNGEQPAVVIDNIHITQTECPPPVEMYVSDITDTSAAVYWTRDGVFPTEDYIIYYKTAYQGHYDTVHAKDPGGIVTGLIPNTEYTVGVSPLCDMDKTYPLTSSFKTLCGRKPLPYVTDFEDVAENDLPECWSVKRPYAGGNIYVVNNWGINHSNALKFNKHASFVYNPYSQVTLSKFEKPLRNLMIKFKPKTSAPFSVNERLDIGYMTDKDSADSFHSVYSYYPNDGEDFQTYTVRFDSVDSSIDDAFITLRYYSKEYDMFVDDIEVDTVNDNEYTSPVNYNYPELKTFAKPYVRYNGNNAFLNLTIGADISQNNLNLYNPAAVIINTQSNDTVIYDTLSVNTLNGNKYFSYKITDALFRTEYKVYTYIYCGNGIIYGDTITVLTPCHNVQQDVEGIICSKDNPYYLNDSPITVPGVYYDTLQTYDGCDSVIHYRLDYKKFVFTDTVCRNTFIETGDTSLFVDSEHYSNYDTITNHDGCLIVLNIDVATWPNEDYTYTDTLPIGDTFTLSLPDGQTTEITEETHLEFQAVNEYGCFYTLRFDIYFTDSSSLNDITDIKNTFIYPNPAKNKVTIETEGILPPYSVTFIDTYARKRKTFIMTQKKNDIDIEDLENGVYQIIIRNNKTKVSKKLIINK